VAKVMVGRQAIVTSAEEEAISMMPGAEVVRLG
jgi:hypothetical protein